MNKVYIAGKLNDDAVHYIQNMHRMIACAIEVRRRGYAVFVPCLDITMGLLDGSFDYNDYFDNNVPFLLSCDAVFVCPKSETSKGTAREVEMAKEKGIPVYYDIEDFPCKA